MKTIIWLMIALITLSTASAFFTSQLGNAAKDPDSGLDLLTATGRARECSDYRVGEYVVFTGSKKLTCSAVTTNVPALVNIYKCNNNAELCDDGWSFVKEMEEDEYFFGDFSQTYVYECYECQETACVGQRDRWVCNTAFESVSCSNGAITVTDNCKSDEECNPNTGFCEELDKKCTERWACGSWGSCKADGTQNRYCFDQNNCGSNQFRPPTQQSCTPPIVETEPLEFKTITASKYVLELNEPVVITTTIDVKETGNYWLEAGSGKIGLLNVGEIISKNSCDAEDKHYANKQINLVKGEQIVKFQITPTSKGRHAFWVAQVTGCGGDALERLNSVENLLVGTGSTGGGDPFKGGIIVFIVIGVAILGIWLVIRKPKKR